MRILFLQKRLILPANTGGKIRTHNILKHLAQWHQITYLCNLLEEEKPYLQSMKDIGLIMETIPWKEAPRKSFRFAGSAIKNFFSRFPLNVDKDFDPKLRQRAKQLLQNDEFDLLICDFVQMARNAIGLPVPSLLFQHNVEAEIFKRLAGQASWPMSWYLDHQSRKMESFERAAGNDFDHIVAVSDRDGNHFTSCYGSENVSTIGTAVDTDKYIRQPLSDSEPNHIIFVGSMDWQPNVEGVQRFVHQIWPRIIARIPTAKFSIVGRNPTSSVMSLADTIGVQVTGTVDDIRPYLRRATLGVVPLYSGGGTRLKIFEFMASQRAVVSTQLGAEGLPVKPGSHLMIADTDEDFADSVVELLVDDTRRTQISIDASDYAHENFITERIARQFETACLMAAGKATSSN